MWKWSRDRCGPLRRSAPALVAIGLALALAPPAAAGALGLVITGGPSGTVASDTATFTFSAKVRSTYNCILDGGTPAPCDAGTVTYSGLSNGSHTFEVDATSLPNVDNVTTTDSQTAAWTVAVLPVTQITSQPPRSTSSTSATFVFVATPLDPATTFECKLGSRTYSPCASPDHLTLAPGTYTFLVRAVNSVGTGLPAAAVTWTITPPRAPDTHILSGPSGSTTTRSATFTFESIPSGATFECSFGGGAFVACSSPATYTGLRPGSYSFAVRAVGPGGADASPDGRTWSVGAVPDTRITSGPSDPTRQTAATLTFVSVPPGARFACALDGGAFARCTSPLQLTGLGRGGHTFAVRASSALGSDPTPAELAWTISVATAGHHWIAPAVGGGGGAAVVLLIGSLVFVLRSRSRMQWQLEASDEKPTGRCEGRPRRCRKETTLKPGPREIAYLEAHARDQRGDPVGERIDGPVVERLNSAVHTYRHDRRHTNELRLALLSVAGELNDGISHWVESSAGGESAVRLEARLEGGKAECVFTLWRCRNHAWEEGRHWKIEVEDERDEPIADLLYPGTTVDALVSFLADFVGRVDVPEPRLSLEAAVAMRH